jgi:hypothetical protein
VDELRPDEGGKLLRAGNSPLKSAHTWALLGVAFGLPIAALLGILATLALAADGPICPAIWDALRAELIDDPAIRWMLYAAAVLLPFATVILLLESRARLRLTAAGLEASIPRLLRFGWFRQTTGLWHVRWQDVRRVRLVCFARWNPIQQLIWYRLVLETDHEAKWLSAFRWHERGDNDHRLGLGELLWFRKLDALARLQSAPLVRAVEERGFAIETEEGAAGPLSAGFQIQEHKGLLAQVIVFFLAGFYALIDALFLRPYLPLEAPPAAPFLLVGTFVALTAWTLGRGAPRLERSVVGALVVAGCMAATYPAMLRLNASTAQSETVPYVSLGEGRFEPDGERFPAVDLSGLGVPEYWAGYPPGARHEFTLQKGSAGFYQLDLAPVYERTRRFYRHPGS